MEIYLICFGLTLACAWINEKLLEHNDKGALTWISAALVILIPSILAGCRDYNIGTDIYVYAKATFDEISRLGLQGVFSKASPDIAGIEPGFKLLAFFTSLVSNSANVFLFSIALVIGVAIYFSLYNMRNSVSIFIGEFIYLFACYNETYNMMRQCLAMSFILLAFSFFLNKRYWHILPCLAVAVSFHFTAVIALPMLLLAYVIELPLEVSGNAERVLWKKLGLLAIVLVVLLVSFKPLCAMLLKGGILPAKYTVYIFKNNGYRFSIMQLLRYIFPYVFLFIQYRKIKYAELFIALALCDIVFYPLRTQVIWLARISTYFFYMKILSFAELKLDLDRIIRDKNITYDELVTVGMLVTVMYSWYYYSIAGNLNETYPYTSKILDIYL